MGKSGEAFDESVLARPLQKRVCPKDIQVGDEVHVEFLMKIDHVTRGGEKDGQVFGFTQDGLCVSAPIWAVVERCPRVGNGGEEVDNGEVF